MIIKNSKGDETYYEQTGDKNNQAVIFLHGLGCDNHVWYPQKERYAGEGYFLIALDLYGHGKSSDIPIDNISTWSTQILALLDFKKIETAIIVGVDFGGVVAQHFTINYQNRVDKVVVSDSFCALQSTKEKLYATTQLASLKLVKLRGDKHFVNKMTSDYQFPYEENSLHYFQQKIGKYRIEQMILAQKIINRVDFIDDLMNVNKRVLVLASADNGDFIENLGKKIVAALPYSHFEVVRRTRNPANLINPENFDEVVLKFMAQY